MKKFLLLMLLTIVGGASSAWAQTNVTSVATGKYYWLKGANTGTGSSYMYVTNSDNLASAYTSAAAVAANGDVWELENATNGYYLKNVSSSKYIKLTANANHAQTSISVSSDDKTDLTFEKHTVSGTDYWLISSSGSTETYKYLNFHYPGMAVWSSSIDMSDNDAYIYELAKYSITILGNNATDVTISGNNHKSIVTDGYAYIDASITEKESLAVTANDGSSASIVAFDSSEKTMTINVSLPTSEYNSAITSIINGSYRIYALDGSTKRYLRASSSSQVGSDSYKVYLGTTTTTASDATIFSITQSTDGNSKEQEIGWKILYDNKWAFTNPEGGSENGTGFNAGTSLIGYDATHRTGSAYDRQLLYYNETAGAYAIRATNTNKISWGASTLWGLDGSGNACYVSDASYIWYFEPVITPAYAKTTYVTTMPLDFSDVDGLKAYRASAAGGGSVTLKEVGAVPAGTPLLLIGTAGTAYTVPVASSPSDPGTNLLEPGDGTTTMPSSGYNYILYSDGLFYRVTSGTVATTKAYLHCDSDPTTGADVRSLSIVFGNDESTEVIELKHSKIEGLKSYFDLQGRRVSNPTKGLYIMNGKKVIK